MLFQLLLLSSLLSGINFQSSNPASWTKGYLLRVVVAFVAINGYVFVVMPAMVGPLAGLLGILIPAYIGRTGWAVIKMFALNDSGSDKADKAFRSFVGSGITLLGLSGMTLLWSVATSEMFNTSHYQQMLGKVGTAELASAKNPNLVPLTTEGMVAEKADDPVGGDKAAIFSVSPSYATAQVIKSADGSKSLIWAVPTDYKGWMESLRYGNTGTMGWTKVNAATPQAPAVMGGTEAFKYTPNGWFGYNLHRHLYGAYPTYQLTDFTLEVDDQGKAWWTVTALRPTSGWGASEVSGIIVVDPVTGQHTFYDTAKVPSWIDRVYPANILHDRITWAYGLKNGYFRFGNNLGLQKPVAANGRALDLTVSEEGEFFGWTGLTSTNASDNAITGAIQISFRTGQASLVKLPTASAPDESKIQERMVAALKDKPGMEIGSPALYEVDGIPAYIAVVTSGSVFKGVIVYHFNSQIFGYDPNGLEGALTRYRLALTQNPSSGVNNGSGGNVKVQVKVARIGNVTTAGETTIYLRDASGKTYVLQVSRLSQAQQGQASLTQVNDTVAIQGAALGDSQVFVTDFVNGSITK